MTLRRARRLIGVLSFAALATIACGGQPDEPSPDKLLTGPSASSTAEVRFDGRIDAMNVTAGQLTVAGRAVTVTSTTEIRDEGARRVLGDLRVGDQVEVRGLVFGAAVVATRIDLKVPAAPPGPNPPAPNPTPPPGAEAEFTGTISSISSAAPGATLIVAGRTVRTNGNTLVRRRGDPVGFDRLRVGQVVEVRGTSQPDGSVLANRITIEEELDQEVEFTGTIASISDSRPGATLVVAGRTVRTNTNTVVRRRGDPVGFDRMRVGQRVEIKGLQQPDGSVLATRITLEED